MKGPEAVQRLCQAAIQIVIRDGLLAMTLDQVAKEAGVSKGGVMHHFPTKEKLVTAMLEHFGLEARKMIQSRITRDPVPAGRWARAMVDCVFTELQAGPELQSTASVKPTASANAEANANLQPTSETPSGDDAEMSPDAVNRFMLAIIAAAVNNPGLFGPLRELGQEIRSRFLNEPDGMEQLLIWLAIDGLFLWEFVGLIQSDDPLYHTIGRKLRERAQGLAHAQPVALTTEPAPVDPPRPPTISSVTIETAELKNSSAVPDKPPRSRTKAADNRKADQHVQ